MSSRYKNPQIDTEENTIYQKVNKEIKKKCEVQDRCKMGKKIVETIRTERRMTVYAQLH